MTKRFIAVRVSKARFAVACLSYVGNEVPVYQLGEDRFLYVQRAIEEAQKLQKAEDAKQQ